MTRSEYQAAAAEARKRKRRIPDPPDRFDDDPLPAGTGEAAGATPLAPAPDGQAGGAMPPEPGEPVVLDIPPPPPPEDPREAAEREAPAVAPEGPATEPDPDAIATLVGAADAGLQRLPPGGPMSDEERGLWGAAIRATMRRLGIEALPLWAHWAAVAAGSLLPRLLAFRAHVLGGRSAAPEDRMGESNGDGGGGGLWDAILG